MIPSVVNLLVFTIALCVFTIVWVWWHSDKVEKATQSMIRSNDELRGHISGILLGAKGIDITKES